MHWEDKMQSVLLYDTTLRDGSQRKGISFSLDDKLKITNMLDNFGVAYIEGGWPGSNPKDMAYFRAINQSALKNARIVAFGSTRRANTKVQEDKNLEALLSAQTSVVTLVGKSWNLHVTDVLQTSLAENLKMIAESIAFLKEKGKEVIFDAEHFFDGFRANPEYAFEAIKTAKNAGADWVVLCDTNGASLPGQISNTIKELKNKDDFNIGIHCHNDGELAVANSLAAVEAGARQIQCTVNGYGERCGNANLISIVPNLQLKLGYQCVPHSSLVNLTEFSRTVAEIANLAPDTNAPFVGSSAFAHKGGLHVAAVEKLTASYEHIDPRLVGNQRYFVVSELSGVSNVKVLASKLGIEAAGKEKAILQEIKQLENQGYQFENAEGTVELMLRRSHGNYQPPFELLSMSVTVKGNTNIDTNVEATIKVRIKGEIFHIATEGNGPINALDKALRKALIPSYPELTNVCLGDYKVRILDPANNTGSTVRVNIEAISKDDRWYTVGCSQNIIDASYRALADSLELYLLREAERQNIMNKSVVA